MSGITQTLATAWVPCTSHARTGRVAGSSEIRDGTAHKSCKWCAQTTITALLAGQLALGVLVDNLTTALSDLRLDFQEATEGSS